MLISPPCPQGRALLEVAQPCVNRIQWPAAFRLWIATRSRRRTRSLPRTSKVSNKPGDALVPVVAIRTGMNRSCAFHSCSSQKALSVSWSTSRVHSETPSSSCSTNAVKAGRSSDNSLFRLEQLDIDAQVAGKEEVGLCDKLIEPVHTLLNERQHGEQALIAEQMIPSSASSCSCVVFAQIPPIQPGQLGQVEDWATQTDPLQGKRFDHRLGRKLLDRILAFSHRIAPRHPRQIVAQRGWDDARIPVIVQADRVLRLETLDLSALRKSGR